MTVAPPLAATLAVVSVALACAHEPWWIIGSAAVALHGAAVTVRDVDVLMAPADARAVIEALGLANEGGAGTGRFRSAVFARWSAPPLRVEFMADFHIVASDGWHAVRLATREAVACGEATAFVPARSELRALLLAIGRDKDRARAALL